MPLVASQTGCSRPSCASSRFFSVESLICTYHGHLNRCSTLLSASVSSGVEVLHQTTLHVRRQGTYEGLVALGPLDVTADQSRGREKMMEKNIVYSQYHRCGRSVDSTFSLQLDQGQLSQRLICVEDHSPQKPSALCLTTATIMYHEEYSMILCKPKSSTEYNPVRDFRIP